MDSNFGRQIERETQSVEKGVKRFFDALKADKAKGREFDGPVGQSLTTELMRKLVPEIEALQHEARTAVVKRLTQGGGRATGTNEKALLLDAPTVAYIALRTVLMADTQNMARVLLARRIGSMINLHVRFIELREQEKERDKQATSPAYNRLSYLVREVSQINPRAVRSWLKKLDDIATQVWTSKEHTEVGLAVLYRVLDALPTVLTVKQHKAKRFGSIVTVEVIALTDAVRDRLATAYKDYAEARPWLTPMVCPPVYWQKTEAGWEGGYLRLASGELFKTSKNKHTQRILDEVGIPQGVLTAINRVQMTAWAINPSVLNAALFAHERGISAVLPVEARIAVPADLPDEVWATLTKEQQGEIKNHRRLIYDHNFRLESKRQAFARQLALSVDLRDEPEIFFPHNMDFRGRLYPMSQDLHPQSDDVGKALLTFAKAKPLGAEGYKWLAYHMANAYGCDKMTRAEQAAWVAENSAAIAAVAADPFGRGLDFWTKAEDKWQFLAAAVEWTAASLHEPHNYLSRLPVHVDGSCNGLQHLSAMGLDPAGAFATNLTTCEQRQDIYQIVADRVAAQVAVDAKAGNEAAAWWVGRVNRKVVKRGVMTVPYGLTSIGMRDQLIEDGWTKDAKDHQLVANYLRDRMRDAITDTVTAASDVMGWMQGNAEILAKNGCPIRWVTPAGMVVEQAYYKPAEVRIYTMLGVGKYRPQDARKGVKSRWEEENTDALRVNKQVHSIVPNIIHSFDAAHMQRTMLAVPDHLGMSISAVHDSFGCHAADMPTFLDVIRNEFAAIYHEDWFTNLQADFEASRLGKDFPLLSPPARGAFDIAAVRQAPFFFA